MRTDRVRSDILEIRYLNTDLELKAPFDLNPLAAALEDCGMFSLQIRQEDDGGWSATLQTAVDHFEPEVSVRAMLDILETLDDTPRQAWLSCSLREFDVGFGCGGEPFSLDYGLSHDVVQRVAGVGAGLRITLYRSE